MGLREFKDLVDLAVSEYAPENSGKNVVDRTMADYRKLVNSYLGWWTPRHFKKEPNVKNTVALLKWDPVRAIIMLRAISRIVRERVLACASEIHVIEVGSGSGFMAAATAVMAENVRVSAYDVSSACADFLEHRAKKLGLADRIKSEGRNLFLKPLDGAGVDVVVAEHLTRGCVFEDAAQLPRRVRGADPNIFVPYAVRPRVLIRQEDNSHQYLDGEREIVLADPAMPDVFDVVGSAVISPHGALIKTANDIRWLSPNFDEAGEFLEQVEGWEYEAKKRSSLSKPSILGNHLYGRSAIIANHSGCVVRSDIRVSYPFGVALCEQSEREGLIQLETGNPATEIR